MRTLFLSLYIMAAALPAVIPTANAAGPIVVIVNSANQQTLSKQDIKNIYSDMVTRWENGERISLYNLPAKEKARDIFSQAVFGETTREIMQLEHNRAITNSVKNPPRTKRASLISTIVRRDKNAIGYLPKDMMRDNKNIRIVLELE